MAEQMSVRVVKAVRLIVLIGVACMWVGACSDKDPPSSDTGPGQSGRQDSQEDIKTTAEESGPVRVALCPLDDRGGEPNKLSQYWRSIAYQTAWDSLQALGIVALDPLDWHRIARIAREEASGSTRSNRGVSVAREYGVHWLVRATLKRAGRHIAVDVHAVRLADQRRVAVLKETLEPEQLVDLICEKSRWYLPRRLAEITGREYRRLDRPKPIDTAEGLGHFGRGLEFLEQCPAVHNESRGRCLERARTALEKALEASPRSSAASITLAKVLLELAEIHEKTPEERDIGRPVRLLKRVLSDDPSNAHAYRICGDAYRLSAQEEAAIEYYSKAVELAPMSARAHYSLNRAFQATGAVYGFNRAIELNPTLAQAYYYRAIDCGVRISDVPDLKRAVALDPTLAKAYFAQYYAYYHEEDQLKECLDLLDKAIGLGLRNPDVYHARGNVYADMGKHDKAAEDYSMAIDLGSEFAPTYYYWGTVLLHRKEHDNAIRAFSKAIDHQPEYAAAYVGRGLAYGRKQDADSEMRDYNKAIQLDPKCARAYRARGLAHAARKNYTEAYVDLATCKRLGGAVNDVLIERTKTLAIQGKERDQEP